MPFHFVCVCVFSSCHFTKGNNSSDFLFASLDETLTEWGKLLKERI